MSLGPLEPLHKFAYIRSEKPRDYYPGLWGAFRGLIGWWKWPLGAVFLLLAIACLLPT